MDTSKGQCGPTITVHGITSAIRCSPTVARNLPPIGFVLMKLALSLCDSRSARAGLPLCRCLRLSWVSLLVSSEKTNITNWVRCVLALLYQYFTQLGTDDSRTHTAYAPDSNLPGSRAASACYLLVFTLTARDNTGKHDNGVRTPIPTSAPLP